MELEKIKSQLEWAKENLSYASPLDNLDVEDVEWLIEQTEKLQKVEYEIDHSDMGTAVDNIIKIVKS